MASNTLKGLLFATSAIALIPVAQAGTTAGETPITADAAAQPGDDIVVTAQKRAERSIDVPASLTAISGAKLEAMQVKQLSDLVSTVPGLSISNYGGPGMNTIQLRGLAGSFLDDFAGPLVATYIDDLPVGSSTAAGRGNLFTLDLQPYDMEGVEILRGPQGTLYGANSMGGLIKYTLKKPDLENFEGRVGTSVGYTNGAGSATVAPRAAVNIPIIKDKLAVRASGFYVNTPGYIDNVGTGTKDANKTYSYGGRVAALWQATDALSVHAGLVFQKSHADDVATVLVTRAQVPVYGDQKTFSYLPTPISQNTKDFTLGADYKLGFATLTTSAGWVQMNTLLNQDLTTAYAAYNPATNGRTRFGLASTLRKFTWENRITSGSKGKIEYTAGVYYTNEHAGEDTNFQALDANLNAVANYNILQGSSRYKYQEIAGFGNATYKFSPKFDLSAGGRYTNYSQKGVATSVGVLASAAQPANTGHVGVGVWSVNGRYHFDRDFMFYGRFSTGYRPGAFNSPNSACNIPAASKPDRTDNYEAGLKGQALDHRIDFELTAYHIKWKNMQLNVSQAQNNTTCIYVTNGGSATSNGVEFSGGFKATDTLRLAATTTYQDAHLDDDLPLSGGKAGDKLPLSSKWQWSLNADWKKPVQGRTILLAGASYSYKGSYNSMFQSTGTPYPFKPVKLATAYVGTQFGQLTTRLNLQNVFNSHSYVGMQYPFTPDFGIRAVPVLPRTVTLSLDYKL